MSQSDPLWTSGEVITVTGGTLDGTGHWPPVSGISIDTRTIEPGDLFVALQDQRDGHDFVTAAFAKGAVLALVTLDYEKKADDGQLLRVDDPLRALEKMAVGCPRPSWRQGTRNCCDRERWQDHHQGNAACVFCSSGPGPCIRKKL